jgi:hypothetical protein
VCCETKPSSKKIPPNSKVVNETKKRKNDHAMGYLFSLAGVRFVFPHPKNTPSTLLFRLLPFAQIPFLGDEIDDDDDDDDDNTAVEEEKV